MSATPNSLDFPLYVSLFCKTCALQSQNFIFFMASSSPYSHPFFFAINTYNSNIQIYTKRKQSIPMGTRRHNDVVSTSIRRNHVTSTPTRRHHHSMCRLGYISQNYIKNGWTWIRSRSRKLKEKDKKKNGMLFEFHMRFLLPVPLIYLSTFQWYEIIKSPYC